MDEGLAHESIEMDKELDAKRKVYEHVLSSILCDEDAAAVEAYVAALKVYQVKYLQFLRQRDELVRQITARGFLGVGLVEDEGA